MIIPLDTPILDAVGGSSLGKTSTFQRVCRPMYTTCGSADRTILGGPVGYRMRRLSHQFVESNDGDEPLDNDEPLEACAFVSPHELFERPKGGRFPPRGSCRVRWSSGSVRCWAPLYPAVWVLPFAGWEYRGGVSSGDAGFFEFGGRGAAGSWFLRGFSGTLRSFSPIPPPLRSAELKRWKWIEVPYNKAMESASSFQRVCHFTSMCLSKLR